MTAASEHHGAEAQPHEDASLWRRWAVATTFGHVIGALFWALPAAWLVHGPGEAGGPATTAGMFALTILAAALQGVALGVAQSRVLRTAASVRARSWVGATAVGVTLGWLFMVIGVPAFDPAWGTAGLVMSVVASGLVFGACVGAAQGLVLGSRFPALPRWVAGNALAWSLALSITVAALAAAGTGWAEALAASGLAAALAGIVLGAVTAWVLTGMMRLGPPTEPDVTPE